MLHRKPGGARMDVVLRKTYDETKASCWSVFLNVGVCCGLWVICPVISPRYWGIQCRCECMWNKACYRYRGAYCWSCSFVD